MTKMFWNIREDFGSECALGDGTDDTDAFENAIDHVCGFNGVLVIPPNEVGYKYKVTRSLKPTAPIKILGAGPNAVTIWGEGFSAGVPIFDYDFIPANNMEHTEIAGMTLRSNNGSPIGIRAKNVSYFHIEDVRPYGLIDGVVYTGDRCYSNSARRLTGYGITGSTVKWNSFRGGGQFTFDHCTFSGAIGTLLDNDSATDRIKFAGCNWEGCTQFSGRFAGTVNGLEMDPRTEGCLGYYDFVFSPEADPRGGEPNGQPGGIHRQSGISINAGMFHSNSAATRAMVFGGGSGYVSGVDLRANRTLNSSADVFAWVMSNTDCITALGNTFKQSGTLLVNSGATVPGMFARGNRNGSGLLANVG